MKKKIEYDINNRFIQAIDDIVERKKNGVDSINKFCQVMKMHRPAYNQIKTHLVNLPMDKAYKIGKMFGLSMNWLLLDTGPMYISKEDHKDHIKKAIQKLQELL